MMGSCGAEDCYPPLQARAQGRARAGHTHQLDSHVLICIQVLSWGGNGETIRTLAYLAQPTQIPKMHCPQSSPQKHRDCLLPLAGKVPLATSFNCPGIPGTTPVYLQCSHGEPSPLGPCSHARTHPHFGGSPTKRHILPRLLAEGMQCSGPVLLPPPW